MIFVVELALMQMGAPLLARLDRVSAALLDAGILTLAFALPFGLFGLRLKSIRPGASPAILGSFLGVLVTLFLLQSTIMLVLPSVIPAGENRWTGLLDASLTLMLSAPLLWWLFRRLRLNSRPVSLADYLNNPVMLYLLLLALIFLADLHVEVFLPVVFSQWDPLSHRVFTSALGTLFIAPVLWLLVTRPLQKSAASEQARTAAVYAQVIDAVITFDAEGMIDCFNPAAERIFGFSAEQVSGQSVSRLFDGGSRTLEQLMHDATTGDAAQAGPKYPELLGRHSDGGLVLMDVSISRIRSHDSTEFLLIMRDISAQKKSMQALRDSEKRFRQLFEQSDDAILFLHPRNGSILDVNQTALNLFGYSTLELAAGGPELFCVAEERQKVLGLIERCQRGEIAQADRLTGRRRDGSELIFSLRVKPMVLLEVNILYCTMRDVTDRVRLEAETQEIQSMLIQANKMSALGLMVSGVAHEINNPNNYILSNAQLLDGYWADANKIIRDYCRENGDVLLAGLPYTKSGADIAGLCTGIIDGSRRINEIVTNLKAFVRQESVAHKPEVDLNQVAASAISILQHEIGRHTSNFEFRPADDLPRVLGNRQQLGQVIVNLLMNACQALSDKTAAVQLQTYLEETTSQVVIEVRDQGCGMPQDLSRLIMEPFFTTKLDSGGTGLGLSICRTIIKEHRGTLDFNSAPGAGTTFFIRLPQQEVISREAVS